MCTYKKLKEIEKDIKKTYREYRHKKKDVLSNINLNEEEAENLRVEMSSLREYVLIKMNERKQCTHLLDNPSYRLVERIAELREFYDIK